MAPADGRHVTGATVLLWMRTDRPREQGMAYWRGPHSQLVARTPGILEHRQHHFPAEPVGLWPATVGVETLIPAHRRIDGTPEVTYDGPLGAVKGLRQNRRVGADEHNVFGRAILHTTARRGGRWLDTSDPGPIGARTVVLLRRRADVDATQFADLVSGTLGPALAAVPGVTEVRLQVFGPFRAWMYTTPDVDHDYPEDSRFHAVIVAGARDRETLEKVLGSAELAAHSASVSTACAAVHAYPVSATYTYRRDGRPTLPQIRTEPKPPLQPIKRTVPVAPPVPAPTRPFPPATPIALPGRGRPEDVVVGADRQLYCGLDAGAVVRVHPVSGAATVVADTGGRPLGLESLTDGRLLVCDAHRGLLRVDPMTGAVETLTQYVRDVPLRFCSNAAAEPDGTIWFTESSTRFDVEHYLGALLEHRPSGRLLRRDPDGSVDVVLDDLHFANGVALAPDGRALILVETGAYRISRIDLDGLHAGQRRTLVENLPGFPDNLSAFVDGRAWVAFPDPRSAALDRAATLPSAVRKLFWRLPEPASGDSIVWMRAIAPDGSTVEDLYDKRSDFAGATGGAELDGHLFLAGPGQRGLLRLALDDTAAH